MLRGASTPLADRLRCAVHIQDDHSSLWERVGLLLVYWVGMGEDLVGYPSFVRTSLTCSSSV